jgi:hypothetical protein
MRCRRKRSPLAPLKKGGTRGIYMYLKIAKNAGLANFPNQKKMSESEFTQDIDNLILGNP